MLSILIKRFDFENFQEKGFFLNLRHKIALHDGSIEVKIGFAFRLTFEVSKYEGNLLILSNPNLIRRSIVLA